MLEIDDVNIVENSSSYALTEDGADSYWTAADELEPGATYTLSVREIVRSAGQA